MMASNVQFAIGRWEECDEDDEDEKDDDDIVIEITWNLPPSGNYDRSERSGFQMASLPTLHHSTHIHILK